MKPFKLNFFRPGIYFAVLFIIIGLFVKNVHANSEVRIVGSSTVYPFTTVVAEFYGRKSGNRTPIVESTGTGGGFKLFCGGIGSGTPDFTNASRAIKDSEIELCKSNKVTDITEIKIGYDGIVIANEINAAGFNLSLENIFLALAKQVPSNGKLIANPYKNWSDIDPTLPNFKIEVYGPPPTSGTRDAFVELVMEEGCKSFVEFKKQFSDKNQYNQACHTIREDGYFIESGENDNLIVQKLKNNPQALGIFGYSFLEQNGSIVKAAAVNNIVPDFDNISDGTYMISRPLYVYLKNQNLTHTDSLADFVREFVSEKSMGSHGYLSLKGLIPLTEEEFDIVKTKVDNVLKQYKK